ncbi:efflux transporter outer membrane subunit [Phenylobacterium sp.]|uniref:efflux transporter outer membrane subunit n=1 Tax=Phenylobacterium sp. TaxID=1871053 RepID=UPI00262FC651|nr:efflux transporter outer membrane subunit [Phenylobacterium sp.]
MKATPRCVWFASTATALMLAGCAARPDFKAPPPPGPRALPATPQATAAAPGVAAGEPQRFVPGGEISHQWWSVFHARRLDALIDKALAANPDLEAAEAALRAAHEGVLAQKAAYLPAVGADLTATRQRQAGTLAPVPNANVFQYSLFTPQVSVSYAPDVFGLNRRTVEQLEAQEQAVRYQQAAAYTTLTANVASTAIQQASVEAQIRITRELIATETELLQIVRRQSAKGYSSGLDVAAQEAQLAQTRAALPPLLRQSAQLQHQLAALTGAFPGEAPAAGLQLSDLELPRDLPVSLPSAIVAQRPDVLQAQANLHAASAGIGIAAANRLPNIQLTGDAGSTALTLGRLFGPGTGFWTLGAAAAAPLFDGGALRHRARAARAAYDQAAQQYRSTVLAAFQNVADVLAALEQDAEALKAAAAADRAARTTLEGLKVQLKDGYAGYPAVLAAEQAYGQAELGLVQAQASRFSDTAALFQALGGGWRGAAAAGGDHGG